MNTLSTTPMAEPDDLPNDPVLLKERIRRQNILLGSQLVELDILKDEIRYLKRQYCDLKRYIWPSN